MNFHFLSNKMVTVLTPAEPGSERATIWGLILQPKWNLLCPAGIKDPLVRSFLTRKDSPFLAFRKYVDQTEDKELEGKVGIVMTYHTRIPELVTRLRGCSQSDFDKAGMCEETQNHNIQLIIGDFIVKQQYVYSAFLSWITEITQMRFIKEQ